MSLNLAQCRAMVAADFRNFDGLTVVSYETLADEDGTYDDAADDITALATRDIDEQEAAIAALFPGRRTVVWHILKEDLDATVNDPHPRDRITDADGVKWITRRVQLQSWDARYRFMCVEEQETIVD